MNIQEFISDYWRYVAAQEEDGLRGCFLEDAVIQWHCTNEKFTVEEFIRANCDYPGSWNGEIERFIHIDNMVITAVRVWTDALSFHVSSFFTLENEKIKTLDEYWGDDGEAPEWRRKMKIGVPISMPCTVRK